MPDDQKKPDPHPGLSKTFKEFAFGEEPDAPAVDLTKSEPPKPPVKSDAPVKLTKEDLDFVPYRGMDEPPSTGRRIPIRDLDEEERIAREEDEAWGDRAMEEAQERVFDAAGAMFRHNHEITNVLTLLSNLEMQSVIAAGILWEQYEHLPPRRMNDMMIAALALNAENFDDICGDLTPESVGMVDELRMMAEEPEEEVRLLHTQNLEPDSKRVLLALTIADLEMTLHEMHDMGDPGPDKAEHDKLATFISALAPGVDRSLRERAIAAFNVVSRATDNGTTLKDQPDGAIAVNALPDFEVKIDPAPKQAKKKQQQPKRRPPQA
ncbi:MAG: hypothetical protein EPN97_07125 [Alphaproteobacteria bacterium]|nr:MAG: hypothetical protein EPN97_07125 [Alphaproteobacteria bacterium]